MIAFISIMAIVRPMQECGPAMKDRNEKVELYVGGRFSQRSGRNLRKTLVSERRTDWVSTLAARTPLRQGPKSWSMYLQLESASC